MDEAYGREDQQSREVKHGVVPRTQEEERGANCVPKGTSYRRGEAEKVAARSRDACR